MGPFGGPKIREFFYFCGFPDCYTQATLAHRQAPNVEKAMRTTTSAGSFLVEVINMRETCTVAGLPHCSITRRACSCFGQAPAPARRCPKLLEKGQARSGCLRPQAQIQGPKKRAVSRPQKWGREMDPALARQFGTRLGGVKLRPQNWGRLAAAKFANSSIFVAFQTATLRRLWPTDKPPTWKKQ